MVHLFYQTFHSATLRRASLFYSPKRKVRSGQYCPQYQTRLFVIVMSRSADRGLRVSSLCGALSLPPAGRSSDDVYPMKVMEHWYPTASGPYPHSSCTVTRLSNPRNSPTSSTPYQPWCFAYQAGESDEQHLPFSNTPRTLPKPPREARAQFLGSTAGSYTHCYLHTYVHICFSPTD